MRRHSMYIDMAFLRGWERSAPPGYSGPPTDKAARKILSPRSIGAAQRPGRQRRGRALGESCGQRFLAGAFLAVVFFAGAFLAADFLAGALAALAVVLFAGAFLAADFLAGALAALAVDFFAGAFLAADFLAGALAALAV